MTSGLPAAPDEQAPTGTARVHDLRYAGLATRVVSFAVDAALITLVDIVVGIGAALILSLLHLPSELRTILAVIGGFAYVLGTILYFVIFWSTTGQTPGARVMQIRVVSADGARVKPRWSLVRCGGVVLAVLPLFAGFVPILFDSRRRGFQDWLARTVVAEAPGPSIAEVSRAKKRAIRAASRQAPPATPE
jgi:uncharacterized RDD family membrane protein YckC